MSVVPQRQAHGPEQGYYPWQFAATQIIGFVTLLGPVILFFGGYFWLAAILLLVGLERVP